MRTVIIIFIFIWHSNVAAAIYKCVKRDGSIYFADRACPALDNEQEISKRDLVLMRFELQQKQLQLNDEKRRRIRADLAAERQRANDARRRLLFKGKCETVQQQIAQLNQRYKQGYTVKQGLALDRKLAECNNRKARYCTNE